MKIKVGWSDILLGTRGNGGDCMLARAIRRQVSAARVVYVGASTVHVNAGELGASHTLPAFVRAKVRRFDSRIPVWPFSFQLELRPMARPISLLAPISEEELVGQAA